MQVIRQGDWTLNCILLGARKRQLYLKTQNKQAVQRKVIQGMTLSTTAHLPANLSSNLKSVVASDVETNTTAALHAQPHMPSAHTARKQGTSRRYP